MPYETVILYPRYVHANTCRIVPSIGSSPSLAGRSCKHINDTIAQQRYKCPPQSGPYWVKVTEQECSGKNQTMQVSEALRETLPMIEYEKRHVLSNVWQVL